MEDSYKGEADLFLLQDFLLRVGLKMNYGHVTVPMKLPPT